MALSYYVLYTYNPIKPQEIYAYRGMLGQQISGNWMCWHNHHVETGKSVKQYPKVQYKILDHHFAIVALASEKQHLFELAARMPLWGQVNQRPQRLRFAKLQYFQADWDLLPQFQYYKTSNLLPMKSEQYVAYKKQCQELGLAHDASTIEHPKLLAFFEQLLTDRIREQAQSLGAYFTEDLLVVKLVEQPIKHTRTQYYNNTLFSKLSNLYFKMNLIWPKHLGIGYGVALGYGMVQAVSQRELAAKKIV